MGFLEQFLTTKLIATVVLVFVLGASRYFIARYIRRSRRDWTSQQRLRWISSTRSFVFILILVSVIFLWGETIQGFAISVFAIAFAMVFSVKELCMSFNGSVVRFRGKFFDIGDRIEVGEVRGDVIDTTLLSTTVEEVGRGASNHLYTGRRISFSNSIFLSQPVINESFLENYTMIRMGIPLKLEADWKGGKQLLLKIAEEEAAPYLEQSRRRMAQMERRRGMQLPSVEPRVTIGLPEVEKVVLHLRMPSPIHLKERLEQVVLSRFLERFYHDAPLEKLLPKA
ncbi:mechanosensitive ion channel family protein [Candidatus Neptunichlamydia sp. REUL1]|jgi:small-conductance mechanosensitive channel|uniref:mechanosensitive ion channel family protein n=1 Tax=Candidatus Neptunichlamydia sp. REUL1 TaxID=3064277 RepID=UPI00292DCBCD|nr:mechanosensitive ion channel family protein [Candidatus Neptunochlamydia sp. REUL1]